MCTVAPKVSVGVKSCIFLLTSSDIFALGCIVIRWTQNAAKKRTSRLRIRQITYWATQKFRILHFRNARETAKLDC